MTAPKSRNIRAGTSIQHSELLTTLSQDPTQQYTSLRFNINPGQVSTFPWLSKTASNYEMYWIRSMRVQYRPRTGYNTNGAVIMYFDYDAKDASAPDYVTAATMEGAVTGAPYVDLTMHGRVPSLMRNAKKYVRTSAPTGDITLYDAGTINIGLQSETGTLLLGEVWIHYVVDLISPQTLSTNPAPQVGSTAIYKPAIASIGLTDGADTPWIINNDPEHDTLGLGPTNASGEVTIPVGADGKYKVTTFGDFKGPDSVSVLSKNVINAGVQWLSEFSSQDDFAAGENYTQAAGDWIVQMFAGDILRNVVSSTDLVGTIGGTLFDSSSWLIEMIEPFLGLLSPAELKERKTQVFAERKVRTEQLTKRLLSRQKRLASLKVQRGTATKTPTASSSDGADDGEIVDKEDCAKASSCQCDPSTL